MDPTTTPAAGEEVEDDLLILVTVIDMSPFAEVEFPSGGAIQVLEGGGDAISGDGDGIILDKSWMELALGPSYTISPEIDASHSAPQG
ncbi:hypothetical protein ACH5RR_004211 [Cinchona calisaya]|uniref:Uncharacterized protein n=1 Tax=Cinchona calisaya TaxID=153742 RepID=A0ABD3AWX2_9GENT